MKKKLFLLPKKFIMIVLFLIIFRLMMNLLRQKQIYKNQQRHQRFWTLIISLKEWLGCDKKIKSNKLSIGFFEYIYFIFKSLFG